MLSHSAYDAYMNNKYDKLNKVSNETALSRVNHSLETELILKENDFAKIDLSTLYACKKALEYKNYYKWHIIEFSPNDLPEEISNGPNAVEIVTSTNKIGTITYTYKHISIKDFINHNEDIISNDENIIAWRYIDWYPCIL